MAGNWNSVVKIFKIFENLLGEFGLELGHLGFIIKNYWLWRWVSGAWRRSMRFCFAFGTAPVGYAPHVRFAVLLCIWDCARGVCSPCAVCSPAVAITAGGLWHSYARGRGSSWLLPCCLHRSRRPLALLAPALRKSLLARGPAQWGRWGLDV